MLVVSFVGCVLQLSQLLIRTCLSDDTVFEVGYEPGVSPEEYCNDTYECPKNKAKHTICEYKCKLGGCSEYEAYEFDNERRQYALDLHNFYRNVVAAGNESRGGGLPPASNMLALNYEVQHELVVHCWMRRCKKGHDQCRAIEGHKYNGQNAYYFSVPLQDKDKLLDGFHAINESTFDWYREVRNLRPGDVSSHRVTEHNKSDTGHATQLLWAKTENVGCGMSTQMLSTYEVRVAIFCNYATGGNVRGRSIYDKGDPASKCPKDMKPDSEYTNLCGTAFAVSKKRRVITQILGRQEFTHVPKEDKEFKVLGRPPGGGPSEANRWSIHHHFLHITVLLYLYIFLFCK